MRPFPLLIFLMAFSPGHAQIEGFLVDAVTGDSLHFQNLSRYETRTWPGLNRFEELELVYFTFAGVRLEKLREEVLWPWFITRWQSGGFDDAIQSAARQYMPLYQRYYELFGEGEFYRQHADDLKVRVEEITLKPISLADHILTIAEVAHYNFSLNQDEDTRYANLFYFDIRQQKIYTRADLMAEADTLALRQKLLEKWGELVHEVPQSHLQLPPYSDIARMLASSERPGKKPVSLDSLVKRGLKNADWNKALLSYTGSGVMVGFRSGFFDEPRLYNLPFQLHLKPAELEGVFSSASPYAFINSQDRARHHISGFDANWQPSYWASPLDFYHLNWSRADTNLQSITILKKAYPEEDPQPLVKYTYRNGQVYQIELLGNPREHKQYFVQWQGGEIFQVSSLQADQSDLREVEGKPQGRIDRNMKKRFRDEAGNVQYSLETTNNARLSIHEYTYFPQRVAEVKYEVLGNALLAHRSFVTDYYLKPDGWCKGHVFCVKFNDRGQITSRANRQYVYGENGFLKQEITADGRDYVLYDYQENDLLSKVEFYSGTTKTRAFKYHYQDGSTLPDSIKSYRDNPGRWVPHQVRKKYLEKE